MVLVIFPWVFVASLYNFVYKQLCPLETVPNWSIKNSLQELVKFESFKMLCILLYKVAESNVVWFVLGFGYETSWKAN